MQIGTYYYPEQWPRHQWERDFDSIAKLGMQIVHIGEFAWFDMEPREGDIRLDWLSDAVEMAASRGMKVILCTPTASPPIWLIDKDPTIALREADGTFRRHGSRRHGSPTSPTFTEATKQIVTALAERFGDHPAVIGWQIDNEYSAIFDQNDHSHAAFRGWLRRKYGTIEKLNVAWGNQFWNTYYTDFSQIYLAASPRDARYRNPHHVLDSSRFWSWAFANFNKVQTDILRPRIGNRFLTTNFMGFHPDCDPADMMNDLDLMSWDCYPMGGWGYESTNENWRIAYPWSIASMNQIMASYHNRWALMELQPGQVNWTGVPGLVYPGAIRLWIWTAFAHGAEFTTTYRWRQPLWCCELFHHGLITTDGVTLSEGGKQFGQVAQEMKQLDLSRVPSLAEERANGAGEDEVGLVFDFPQQWWYAILPQARRWNQHTWLMRWYIAIMKLGLRVRIVRPEQQWPTDLRAVVVPASQMVTEAFVKRMDDYTRSGGHLVLTCRTALMNEHGHLWEGPTAQPILPLIGATITGYDSIPDPGWAQVEMNGQTYPWGPWADLLQPGPDTKVLARYADQFYKGTPAVTRHSVGRGAVTYCGVFAEQGMIDALMADVATAAGISTTPLPDRVELRRRGPYRILLNYQDQPVDAPAPANAKFVLGDRKVGPADVAIWEE